MRFKIAQDVPDGLCGSCANAHVQRTAHNRVIVRCMAMGKSISIQVKEPMEYCQSYKEAEVFRAPFPKWMEEVAWLPVQIQATDGWKKTLLPPTDKNVQGSIFDPWPRLRKMTAIGAEE